MGDFAPSTRDINGGLRFKSTESDSKIVNNRNKSVGCIIHIIRFYHSVNKAILKYLRSFSNNSR